MDSIVKYIPQYQACIQSLKDHGYTALGYARKSPSAEGKNRLLVEKVFVSLWRSAGDPFASRDLTGKGVLIKNLETFNWLSLLLFPSQDR